MASEEQPKMTHSVDRKVMGVDDRVRSVEGQVQGVCGHVQSKMSVFRVDVQDVGNMILRPGQPFAISLDPDCHSAGSDSFTGNQFRDSLLRWLSPSNPSTNHNIARKAHHDGTTQWFFQGRIFDQWKSSGPFLWVHGKRALLLAFAMR